MSRLNLLVLAVVIACALSVVNSTYQQRRLFIEYGRAQAQEHELQQAWAQLQYQQGALSKTTRIENVATTQLHMQAVTPGRTQYLTVDPATTAVVPAHTVPASTPVQASAAGGRQ
jgi:cell division protein FtsL